MDPVKWNKLKICRTRKKKNHQECFNLFADTFGKCMVKRELWKNKLSRNPNLYFSDVVTISDEAFAIFTIERNWNIWENEHDGAEVKLRSGEYTTLNTNVKYGGWTKERIKRFENLCENVMNKSRHFKVRADMEKIYKLESDDDNTESQSFGDHFSDDDGQMKHDDRYDYHSETSATY